MDILSRQKWSVDFLVYLLKKAQDKSLAIRIKEPDGRVLEIMHDTPVRFDYKEEEDTLSQDEWDLMLGLREAN